ncbi:MAG: glycosyltransferase family 4 protein [Planctomycetota bacterium]
MTTFCGSFIISVALVLLIRRAALQWGFVDHPGGRKAHGRIIPYGGGIAILLGAGLPLLGATLLSWLLQARPSALQVPESVSAVAAQAASRVPLLLKVLAGGLAIAALGFWDDARGLSARTKLAGQFLVALAVALIPDVRVTLFIQAGWAQVAVTTAWIMLMMNAFNLLDNVDGQSGLVAFLTGGALLVLALQTGQYFIAGFLLALLGSVLGFLMFNLPPASIFMGDMGSMLIGYVLAVATTLATFVTTTAVNPLFPVLVPLVIFAVPLYDVLSVSAIRIHKGRPLLAADRSHMSHRLMRLGMGERTVLLTVALMVVATSPGATIPYGSSTWRVFVPAAQALAVVLVIVLLELVSASGRGRRGEDEEATERRADSF